MEVDLDRDQLQVVYDPQKVDRERMIAAVRKQGFEADIRNE